MHCDFVLLRVGNEYACGCRIRNKKNKKCTCTNNVLRIPIYPYFSFIVSNENSLVYNSYIAYSNFNKLYFQFLKVC